MQLFSEDATIFSKKIFAHENLKKQASKVAHNRPQTFFHSTGPAAQTSPELIFHIEICPKTPLSPHLWTYVRHFRISFKTNRRYF